MLSKFLSFDEFITPSIIVVLFWIGVVINVLFGLGTIIGGIGGGGFGMFFGGLAMLVIGPIMTKVWCELLMVFFKIHETLIQIRDK